jgi:HEAT repeat protein
VSRVLFLVLAVSLATAAEPPADETAPADERLLKDAGVAAEGPALLDFFRKRTLTAADRADLDRLIRQLGSDNFDEREAASKRLPEYGTTALPALRTAANDADAERARRAREAADRIEETAVTGLPGAAARMLARTKPAGATAALLAYLPFAADPGVEDEVLGALLTLNPTVGKADAALVPALADAHAARRGAAAHVLGRRGDDGQRAGVRKLLADKDARVRFRAAVALVAAEERSAVPPLIDLLGEDLGALTWQVEDALFRLAGEQSPPVSVGLGGAEARAKARDAWQRWWKDNGDKVDLSRFETGDRLLGLTLGIEYNTGRVWECGRDGVARWEIKGLQGPMEAQVLPGGRVLIAESNNKTISERDFQGKVLWQKVLPHEPTGVQRLPSGNTFVSSYNRAMEFDRDGKTVFDFDLGGGSNAIRKARNGHVIFVTDNAINEVDETGKKVRSIPIPQQSMWVGVRDLPGDRFLVCNSNTGRIIEVDAAGKLLWEANLGGACGIAKLPNGHVLVGTSNLAVEVDRAGKRVWELSCPGYVRRIHRR